MVPVQAAVVVVSIAAEVAEALWLITQCGQRARAFSSIFQRYCELQKSSAHSA